VEAGPLPPTTATWGHLTAEIARVEIGEGRLRDLLGLWELSSRSGSPHTARARRQDLDAYGRWLGIPDGPGRRLETLRVLLVGGSLEASRSIAAWVADSAAQGYAARTIARRVASLRSVVALAHDHGLPWVLASRGPSSRGAAAHGPLPARVAEVLADLGRRSDARAARDRALVCCLYFAGLRRAEVCGLDLSDFDAAGSVLASRRGKGGHASRRHVARVVVEAIAAWVRKRGRQPGPLFTAMDQIGWPSPRRLSAGQVCRLCHGWGLGHPHGLRHTAATVLAKAGRLDLAQAHLGHANVGTTSAYLDRSPEDCGEASRILAGEASGGDPA